MDSTTIAILGLVAAIVAAVAAILVIPEVRRWLGLELAPSDRFTQEKIDLASPDLGKRRAAMHTLEQSRDPAAREVLVKATQHPSREVRIEPIFALARLKDKHAVPPLIDLLHDEENWNKAVSELVKFDTLAIPDLVKVLNSDNAKQKRVANLLGRIPKVMSSIFPCLRKVWDSSLSVRAKYAIISALGKIGGDEAIMPLRKMVRNQDEAKDTRLAAIDALGQPKNTAAIEDLKEVIRDPDLEVRKTVIRSLGRIGNSAAMLPLKKIARNQDKAKDIRLAAIDALGQPKNTGPIYFLRGLFLATMRPSPDNLLELEDLCGRKYEDIEENRCIIVSAGKALRKIGTQDALNFLQQVEQYIPDQNMVGEIWSERDPN